MELPFASGAAAAAANTPAASRSLVLAVKASSTGIGCQGMPVAQPCGTATSPGRQQVG